MKYPLIIPIVLCALHAASQSTGDAGIMNQADVLINNYQFRQALSLMDASGDSLNADMLF